MQSFRQLGLIEPILKSIEEQGFNTPTEIQEKSIPLVVKGKDLVGGAATGSGKTLAFAAALIKNAERGRGIQGLILTPTRELAKQVSEALAKFFKHKGLRVAAVYGGVGFNPQMNALRTVEIVVGTPGRLLDHLGRGTLKLDKINTLVLDEADRMLDMGFIDDVRRIISACPKERQTLLFSATITSEIVALAKGYMKSPVRVSAEVYVDPRKLEQVYYDVAENEKFSLLVHLLKHEQSALVMVFCNSRRTVDFVSNNLKLNNVAAVAIHGGLSQDRREKMLKRFLSRRVNVLVSTDVASRGLDIQGVSHVYNYDAPNESKQYVHRIGRTARAGKSGKAVNLISQRDHDNFRHVLEDNDVSVKKLKKPVIQRAQIKWRENKRNHPQVYHNEGKRSWRR